jgi:hypothetical protein
MVSERTRYSHPAKLTPKFLGRLRVANENGCARTPAYRCTLLMIILINWLRRSLCCTRLGLVRDVVSHWGVDE